MPPPEQIFSALMSFLTARSWEESRRVLSANQAMLNVWVEMIDVMITDPTMVYRGMGRSEAASMLKKHKLVLMRCQQIGVARAFAEIG